MEVVLPGGVACLPEFFGLGVPASSVGDACAKVDGGVVWEALSHLLGQVIFVLVYVEASSGVYALEELFAFL